jgi:hypothetical protein
MTDPVSTIFQLSIAYWPSRVLHIVAEAGVADVLQNEPATAAELAAKLGVNPLALHRLLRALVNRGIFELKDGRFSHNECSRLLRTDSPVPMRSRAMMDGLPVHWNAYGALGHSLKTGKPAVNSIIEEPNFFAWLGAHPDEAHIFAGAMAGKSVAQVAAVLKNYDFSGIGTIGDIGGSYGHLLQAVLNAYPQSRGVLFELPEIIEGAKAKAVNPRINYVAGDFFKDGIPQCDAYLLMMVLHDWSDEQAVSILRNIRRSAPPSARFLVIEGVVDEAARGNLLLDIDIEMMALTTGRERTRAEWAKVFADAGLDLRSAVEVAPWTSIIEGTIR